MTEEKLNVFAVFEETAMSYEDAEAKVKAETRVKTNYFRIDKDGEYNFRVLPLAPVNVDGKWVMDRQGYEYPLTSYMVGFPSDKKGKFNYVTVIDPRQVFPNVSGDLFRAYYDLAVAELGDDKDAVDSLGNIVTKGGAAIRPSFQHCMYVIDMDDPGKGIQMLQLSNTQYQDLETTKMSTWRDLRKKNPKAPCPLTSIEHAYDVIANRNSGQKPAVKFTLGRFESPLEEKVVTSLLDTERIPNIIYRYTRYHLEATVAYLKLIDERYDFNFMAEGDNGEFANDEINTIYQQIKMSIPADDHSHFSITGLSSNDNDNEEGGDKTLDELKEMVKNLGDVSKDDPEYKSVMDYLNGYITNNNLDITVRRYHTPEDILDLIEDEEAKAKDKDEKPADTDNKKEEAEDNGNEQNPDTAEPAARPARQRRQ